MQFVRYRRNSMSSLFTLLTGSREGDISLAVIISLTSIAVFAIVAYLTFYFFAYKMMRKRSDWGKRAFFLILVSVIGLGVRFVCVLSKGVHSFQEYLTFSVQTIYATIGVFSFEGQENPGLYDLLYFYATLWVAVTYVVVIFTGFNYSLQSRIALSLPKSPKTEFYIFTKVTDESYALAVGIEKRCRKDKIPFKIIFASDEIDTFDAKKELHKKIRSSGYYFVSIEKKASDKEKKPIIDSLGIKCWRLSKVHIFAMERDESNRGNETRNSDIIFDDIGHMIEKLKDKRFAHLINEPQKYYIQYFIYVNNEINSEFFTEMLRSKLPEGTTAQKYEQLYQKFFRVKGFSEAQLCGISLLKKREELEVERIKQNLIVNKTKDDVRRALVIGFGPNGQASLKNLYIDSNTVCKDGVTASGFEAHILDRNINSFSGVYELSHPSIIFRHGKEFLKPEGKEINLSAIKDAYQKDFGNKSNVIIKKLNFPVFNFYEIDCKGEGILEQIADKCKEGYFNSVIISMGNDERNIELSNALLRYLRQYVYGNEKYSDSPLQLDIFINLREENAEKRLLWNSLIEKSIHPGLNVVAYGDYRNMFTYDNIVSDERWIFTNNVYNALANIYNTAGPNVIKQIKQYGLNEDECIKILSKQNIETAFIYDFSNYNRESSNYAFYFYRYYVAYYDACVDKIDKQKIYDYLASIEHVRWNRFVIISGFIYSSNLDSSTNTEDIANYALYSKVAKARMKYSKEFVRIHKDIVPTDLLTDEIFGYDYMNVLAARYIKSRAEEIERQK